MRRNTIHGAALALAVVVTSDAHAVSHGFPSFEHPLTTVIQEVVNRLSGTSRKATPPPRRPREVKALDAGACDVVYLQCKTGDSEACLKHRICLVKLNGDGNGGVNAE